MKVLLAILSALMCMLLAGCGDAKSIGIIGGADGPTSILITEGENSIMYKQITPQDAKQIMDTTEGYVVLDVREQEEFDAGHIPGAVLIPYTEITQKAESVLADKEQTILVYCRSGRRSKIAALALSELGYTDVQEFGGIMDWPYEVVQ